MPLVLTLALQAASAPAEPVAEAPAAGVAAVDFDLGQYRPSEPSGRCAARPGEIVVCGRRDRSGDYPIGEWERLYAARPLVAEMGIAGSATGRVFVESATMPNGEVSSRVMVGIRVPF